MQLFGNGAFKKMEEMTAQEKQFHKMTETPVPGLVTKLAVPTIISMLTTAIYNMQTRFLSLSWAPALQVPWESCFPCGADSGRGL